MGCPVSHTLDGDGPQHLALPGRNRSCTIRNSILALCMVRRMGSIEKGFAHVDAGVPDTPVGSYLNWNSIGVGMRKLLIIIAAIGWVAICLTPWVAMEPNIWRVPAAIGLAPVAVPVITFGWLGGWHDTKKVLRTFMPGFVVRAWDNS